MDGRGFSIFFIDKNKPAHEQIERLSRTTGIPYQTIAEAWRRHNDPCTYSSSPDNIYFDDYYEPEPEQKPAFEPKKVSYQDEQRHAPKFMKKERR